MAQGFLEQESIKANRRNRKLFLSMFAFFACMAGFLYFATKNTIDTSDPRDQKLIFLFVLLIGLMLFCTAVGLLVSILPARNGKNLILPCGETTKETAAELIDREVAEGKILYEGFMNHNTVRPYPNRVILLPMYLLLVGEMGRVTAIPRDKIYWLCAQVGYKGGPYYVRLLLFTERQLIEFNGNDIEHTQEIAADLYQYIPNVFSQYDSQEFEFCHRLEKLFREDPAKFLEFYKRERNI
ncbi:MAG: hypothetical protein NC079_00875 [Clostridium sp.]|nr:hypothetical protein [Acetatifactor muris]MCM1528243.1 hypothetical protein [Bacteroides sp.]MCM1562143.1 hypothetical protein [Clostridium sp.]